MVVLGHYPGVVVQDVELAVVIDRRVDHRLCVALDRDVHADRRRLAAAARTWRTVSSAASP